MDGTLTQTNQLIFASFNHIAQKYLGKTLAPREIIALFGPPEEGGLQQLVGEPLVNQAMDELCDFYARNHESMASLHTGIEELLHALKQRGIPMAVFTGKGRRTAEITLDALKLSSYFDLIVSGSDVVRHKPAPEGIQKIMSALSVPSERVLMIGDGLSDVRASKAAGVKMAAVLWDSYDRDRVLAEKTDFVFYTVEELHAWFLAHLN